MHGENLQVGLGMQHGSPSPPGSTCTHTHTYTHTHKQAQENNTPLVPCSMSEQAAPDTAVAFPADNLLPWMPALSFVLHWEFSLFRHIVYFHWAVINQILSYRHRLARYVIVWFGFFHSSLQSIQYWYTVLSLCVVLSSSSWSYKRVPA